MVLSEWLKILLLICLLIIIGLLIYRRTTYCELDDLHPNIPCKPHLLKKCKYLWVIPKYQNIPITDDPEWCQQMKRLADSGQVILGMHGVYHHETIDPFYQDGEFNHPVPVETIKEGMEIFKQAFGYYPKYFKAPHCLCCRTNQQRVRSLGMEYKGVINQCLHKVYHTNDEQQNLFLKEGFVDLF